MRFHHISFSLSFFRIELSLELFWFNAIFISFIFFMIVYVFLLERMIMINLWMVGMLFIVWSVWQSEAILIRIYRFSRSYNHWRRFDSFMLTSLYNITNCVNNVFKFSIIFSILLICGSIGSNTITDACLLLTVYP